MKLTTLLATMTGMAIAYFTNTSVLAREASPQQGSSYQTVTSDTATSTNIDVSVYPGRATVIDFSQTSEAIAFIMLADPSRVVFNTDLPLDTGAAQTILLRPIQPLEFPGTTTTLITNLVVKTVGDRGQTRLYNFSIVPSQGNPSDLGIYIIDKLPELNETQREQITLKIRGGRTATLQDVEIGLQLAIQKGYTNANDPLVRQVKEFIALIRNFDISLQEAIDRSGVKLVVLTELAQIAIEDYFNASLLSTPAQPEANTSNNPSSSEQFYFSTSIQIPLDFFPFEDLSGYEQFY